MFGQFQSHNKMHPLDILASSDSLSKKGWEMLHSFKFLKGFSCVL